MRKSTIVGTIVIAIMWIVGMLAIVLFALRNGNDPLTAKATADMSVTATTTTAAEAAEPATKETEEEEPETRVLLVDRSGSTDGLNTANIGYDTVVPFSQFLGQMSGNSYICTNIVRVLDMGVTELGIFSDLESYPEDEQSALEGKYYSNREVVFYLPEDVDEECVEKYETLFSEALEEESCTLIFCYYDGTKVVIYDNYGVEEVEEETVKNVVDMTTDTTMGEVNATFASETTGSYVDVYTFATVVAVLYTIIMALLELLLLLFCSRVLVTSTPQTPDDVQQALKNPTALDGSSSVAHLYHKLVDWAKAEGVSKVYHFADSVKLVTLKKAERISTGGQTHGWEVLAKMFADGHRSVTIVSDFEFNDEAAACDGVSFDEVVCIVPGKNYDHQVVDQIKQMATNVKVIEI